MSEYIFELSKGRKILHFGACDHLEIIDKKINSGQYFHKIISDISEKCLGVDINVSLIQQLRQKYKIDNIIYFDLINDPIPVEIKSIKWDCILLFDVIEHIDKPILFMSSLHKKFRNISNKIVVSVPNAFRVDNFLKCFKNIELINTDHRYWFTPYTITKVIYQSGFIPENIFTMQRGSLPKRNYLKEIVIKKFNLFRDTIVVEAKFL